MTKSPLIRGLLACACEQLLQLIESNPGDPHAAQIADATDHTAAAIAALARVSAGAGLSTPDGVTYVPWTDGHALGYRCLRETESDYYIYLNPSGDTDDGVPNVFVYVGERGDPAHDQPIVHAVVPRQAGASQNTRDSTDYLRHA